MKTLLIALIFLYVSPIFAQSVTDVELGTLLRDIENNVVRARQVYGNKTIRTRGRVQDIWDGYITIGVWAYPFLVVYLNNSEIAKLQKGQTITVRGVFGIVGETRIGGLQRAVVEANPPSPSPAAAQPPKFPATHRLTANLNVFSQQDGGSSVVASLKKGDPVKVLEYGAYASWNGITAKWAKVQTIDNKTGWLFSGYLEEAK